jgi:tRNA A37 methylthiotransferase MiaB
MIGRSPYLQPVHLDARGHEAGDIVRVRVTAVMSNSLRAALCDVPFETAATL